MPDFRSIFGSLQSGGNQVAQSVIGIVAPPAARPDPVAALADMRLRPELCERVSSLLAKHGAGVDDAVIKDPYGGSTVRHYTALRVAGGERLALLSIPNWILGDGNYVATVEGVRYLFRGKSIRLVSETLDIPWFGLEARLTAWKEQDHIDGRFVPWSYFTRALDGTHELAQVLMADLDGAPGATVAAQRKLRIFISYAHEDENYMTRLVKHLSILRQQGLIEAWHDRKIGAGKEWAGAIDKNLETADVILLLVSADFVSSEYCTDIELKRAMQRHESGEARVVPVIVRQVDWGKALFAKLQALPKDAKPIKSWSDDDEAFTDVARGIRGVVEEITGSK
jgi:hypothetical protein